MGFASILGSNPNWFFLKLFKFDRGAKRHDGCGVKVVAAIVRKRGEEIEEGLTRREREIEIVVSQDIDVKNAKQMLLHVYYK